jgi:hypothetical protein
MIIHKADDFDVCRIDFCCKYMAEDILFGRVKTNPWTDHGLCFYAGSYTIKHCGHCGAKIVGEKFGEKYYTGEQK